MFRSLLGKIGICWAAAALSGLALVPAVATAADHRDGPRIVNTARSTGNLDLNDLFVFRSPQNRNNSVFVLTTGGNGLGFVTPPFFAPGSAYEFRISNDGNPTTDELVIQFVFSDPGADLRQSYVMTATTADGQTQQLARGVTGRTVRIRGGGQVSAGIFDDPFFFDSIAFAIFSSAVARGAPLAERVAAFTGDAIPNSPEPMIRVSRPPNNGFANTNTLAIVVEVPRFRVQSARNNPNITVWIRSTNPDGSQFERTALPAVNTTIVPPGAMQDAFNLANPLADPSFRPAVVGRLMTAYGAREANAMTLAMTLLPDVMPFNTTNSAGFNEGLTLTLNGRRLADDVVDAELNALTEGALTSDRVVNDSVFRRRFPYLGPPLPVSLTIRSAQEAAAAAVVGAED